MRNKKDFITLKEVERRSKIISNSYKPKLNRLNFCIGSIMVSYGIVTIILPTGSIFAISLGVSLALCPIGINKLIIGLYRDIRFKIGCWL